MMTDDSKTSPLPELPRNVLTTEAEATATATATSNNNNNNNNKSSCSCCPEYTGLEGTGFGITLTVTQLLALFVFLISALPYWINFDETVKDSYEFDTLNWIKTIWIRVHVIASTFNLILGPVQVVYGLLRKAGNSKVHKYLGYTYTLAMVLCILTSVPLIILRYIDDNPERGGPWIATPLIALTIYQAITLFLGIRAIAIQGDKPLHRRMIFRNYCGVFVFVTFRLGIVFAGGNLETILPTVFTVLTFLATEAIVWKFPTSFEDKTSLTTEDADWQADDTTTIYDDDVPPA